MNRRSFFALLLAPVLWPVRKVLRRGPKPETVYMVNPSGLFRIEQDGTRKLVDSSYTFSVDRALVKRRPRR